MASSSDAVAEANTTHNSIERYPYIINFRRARKKRAPARVNFDILRLQIEGLLGDTDIGSVEVDDAGDCGFVCVKEEHQATWVYNYLATYLQQVDRPVDRRPAQHGAAAEAASSTETPAEGTPQQKTAVQYAAGFAIVGGSGEQK